MIEALGAAAAGPLIGLLAGDRGRRDHPRAQAVVRLLLDHAPKLADGLVPVLDTCDAQTRRTVLRVLGSAGPGHEDDIAACLAHDEQTGREALRALARLGTPRAARLVVHEILTQRGALALAAEETLWHFPADEAQRWTRELLGRRDFTQRHPRAAERLLDRAARTGGRDLGPVLLGLAPLRFRVWNPALARVARKANAMLKSPATQEAGR
jgi:hypothetical protein